MSARHEQFLNVFASVSKIVAKRPHDEELPAIVFWTDSRGEGYFEVVQSFLGSDEDKQLLVMQLQHLVGLKDMQATVMVTEAWATTVPKGTNIEDIVRPSLDPERQELMVFVAEDHEGYDVHTFTIDREAGVLRPYERINPETGEPDVAENIETRFLWFPENNPDTPDERILHALIANEASKTPGTRKAAAAQPRPMRA